MTFRCVFIVIAVCLITGCSAFGVRTEYEQPPYVVVEKLGQRIEVRRYAERLAAETVIDISDHDESSNSAFRTLFNYISGNNRVAADTTRTPSGEIVEVPATIAMTVPVETSYVETKGTRMRFFLPSEFTLETAPRPTDGRVRLLQITAQLEAVLRFNGSVSENSVAKKRKDLLRALDQSSWRAVSGPVTYLYDPPWTIPFFRRNEIVIPVVLSMSQEP